MQEGIERFGPPPSIKPLDALRKMLKARDLYDVAASHNLRNYDPQALRLLEGRTTPKPLESLLPPSDLRLLEGLNRYIALSTKELDALEEAGELPSVKP